MMRFLLAAALALISSAMGGQQAPAEPGPPVGSRVPDFEATDQNAEVRSLHGMMGPKGLMLVFIRSADW
jgi:hypothetical protein